LLSVHTCLQKDDESGLAGVAAGGRYFQRLLGGQPASCAVAWVIQNSANADVRPFDLALQAVKGLAKETPGLFRMVPASTTKMVVAIATASAVAEHLTLERHREVGGPRVAQEE
jgi:hypothetical protein